MPFPAAFPQELLDRFVDCLSVELRRFKRTNTAHEVNKRALLNCSQASSALYYRATRGLFSRLFIKTPSQEAPRRFSALVKILTPSLATSYTGVRLGVAHHIVEFYILLYGRSCLGAGVHDTCLAKEDAVKALNYDTLVSILSKLHTAEYGITKFSLTWGTPCCQISWANLSPQFQQSFRDLILSPYINYLELLGEFSNIPGSTFSGSKMRHLQINSLNLESDNQAEPAVIPPVELPNLESFCTNYSFDIDLSPTTSPLTELKKMKAINIAPDHLSRTERILRLATNSLQDVTVQFHGK
ncbi:hypothetical protein NLJ89_g8563 [Agrocybe chaxingu]|uniref:Uncharacterized protein n=1 Tax=Agrocybe chaxingu TaxID=84603 RepID=A0A9W8JUM9_9AGAR|nr:hypothetical protein NLJ89_g8563 [Agrocybe chaxingu]